MLTHDELMSLAYLIDTLDQNYAPGKGPFMLQISLVDAHGTDRGYVSWMGGPVSSHVYTPEDHLAPVTKLRPA